MRTAKPRGPRAWDTVRFYWRTAVKPYPRQAATILLLMLGSAVLDALTVGLTVPLLDVLTAADHGQGSAVVGVATSALGWFGMTPTMNVVMLFLMGVASLLFLARGICWLLSQYVTAAVAVEMRRTMKTSLFERFLRARYDAMSARARGAVVNDINQPAESIAAVITQLGYLLTGVLTSALMVALLVYLSWWVTLVIAVLAIGGVQGCRVYADRRSAAHGRALYGLLSEQNKLHVDAIDGLKVVKAHGLERRLVERQQAFSAAERRPELQLVLFRNVPTLVNEVLAIIIVVGLGVVTFLMPSLGIRFSMLAAFLLAIRRIAPSLALVNSSSVNLNRYKRHLEVIEEVLGALPQERRGGRHVGPVSDIEMAGVEFAYPSRPHHRVLTGVTASFHRGTVTAIVGATGSGKSTLANLLLGLFEPGAGAVRINGIDVRELDMDDWRRHVGYVPQDFFVFNATVRENLTLGDQTIPQAQLEWAARVAQLHDFITTLPEGYDTLVGDRGLRLSGGQCQRLAIARAILRRPEVLIFDEATSALDHLTERAVYNAINALHQEAIVLVITHRLSSVKEADCLMVLQRGAVVERGSHPDLMAQDGVYASLYQQDKHAAPSNATAARADTVLQEHT